LIHNFQVAFINLSPSCVFGYRSKLKQLLLSRIAALG